MFLHQANDKGPLPALLKMFPVDSAKDSLWHLAASTSVQGTFATSQRPEQLYSLRHSQPLWLFSLCFGERKQPVPSTEHADS